MIVHYFKVAFRHLLKFRVYSAINIGGLSIGIACFLVIALYVRDELSYDRFHSKSDRIYRVTETVENLRTTSSESIPNAALAHAPVPLTGVLEERFPQIEETVRLQDVYGSKVMAYGERSFNEERIYYTEPSFFDVFDMGTVSGDPAGGLSRPGTVAVSESVALKYFGTENPVGRVLRMDNEKDLEVVGVFRDLPGNSHLSLDFLISFESISEESRSNWRESVAAYLTVRPDTDVSQLEARLAELPENLVTTGEDNAPSSGTVAYGLMPLNDIHLFSRSHLAVPLQGQGDIRYIYLFSAVAFIILLIAGINYVNITTARAAQRAREVGVRKAVGARKSELVRQFLAESALVLSLAMLAGIVLAELSLPIVNGFVGRTLDLDLLTAGSSWLVLAGIVLTVGLMSGGYSAFVLSRFNPVDVIKGDLGVASWNVLRKVLVVFQFGISTIMMIATLVMYYQLQYLQDKNLGFNKEQVLTVPMEDTIGAQAASFKQELLKNPRIQSVSLSRGAPGTPYGILVFRTEEIEEYRGDKNILVFNYFQVDEDFQRTYETRMASGRMFSSEFGTDDGEAVIINEAAARALGWQGEVVGRSLPIRGGQGQQIIGIMEDFHMGSLKSEIEPMVMLYGSSNPGLAAVRVSTDDLSGTLDYIRSTWEIFAPAFPFTYSFLDDIFEGMYRAERDLSRLFGIFTLLAVCIASLGLFGLASYTTRKRMREIGIRKVLGAGVRHIVGLLSRDFAVLLAVSFVIATPLTWYYMNQWLANFAYRIEIGPGIYLVAALISVAIVAVSIGWQAMRASRINPVTVINKE